MQDPNMSDLKLFPHIIGDFKLELEKRGKAPELPIRNIHKLNTKLWGLHKRKMMIIGARTSNGKSALAINLAYDLSEQGKKVVFLSLEMPITAIMERIFCMAMTIDNIGLLKGDYNKDDLVKNKMAEFEQHIKNFRLSLSDCIGRDWDFVESIFAQFTDIDAVFIDHIQEIRGGFSQKEAIDTYISKIRESAVRHNFALVVCSQVNRLAPSDKDNREPQLHHLKATGFLEEAADQVILMHWPYHYDNEQPKNDLVLNVAKNRDGFTGYMKVKYYPEYCQIRDTDYVPNVEPVKWDE